MAESAGHKGRKVDLDRDIEDIRARILTVKDWIHLEAPPESIIDFDTKTEELIAKIFGSASPMLEAYEYAQLGDAAGMMNLPEEAPESGTQSSFQETVRQRLRVLESCLAELETRRAAASKGIKHVKLTGPRVADYMTRTIRAVPMDATLREAGTLLEQWKIGSLLVQGGDEYVGSITETELTREVVAHGLDPLSTTVKTCMREPLVTVETSDPIIEAVRLMKEKATRHLAVVESNEVVGVISVSDIIRYYSGIA
ncbi:MAG: CBS domain-containing protein [Nitrospirae bacterium]|nr:MAG: CBS domain-containing protein [Nitrospirota bacterium]